VLKGIGVCDPRMTEKYPDVNTTCCVSVQSGVVVVGSLYSENVMESEVAMGFPLESRRRPPSESRMGGVAAAIRGTLTASVRIAARVNRRATLARNNVSSPSGSRREGNRAQIGWDLKARTNNMMKQR
jgi:hypothetical protein